MPREMVAYQETFSVVQHPGQGLLVFPAKSFFNVMAAATKQPGSQQRPKVSRMTRAEIEALLAQQRLELAAAAAASRPSVPNGYQLSKDRRKPRAAVRTEQRVRLLRVVADFPDGVGMVELTQKIGVKPGTLRSQLMALEEAGLICLSRMPRKGAGGQPQIFSRVTQKGRDQVAGQVA